MLRTLAVASLLFASCAATDDGAHDAPGDGESPLAAAFLPLDLPAPNELRGASGAPGGAYWQQQADYVIQAAIDPAKRAVKASAVITYSNRSPDALDYVWLHLEQNLYSPCSVGRTVNKDGRYAGSNDDAGGCALHSIKSGGKNLAFRVYDTLARVELPSPLAPRGGVLKLEISWSFAIPEYGTDRLGRETVADGEIFLIAQWFPAIVKYDDVRGWNALPYLGAGEFYTDFGDYDVSITAPKAMLVAAGGVLQNEDDLLSRAERARLEQARSSRTPVTIVPPGTAPLRATAGGVATWRFKAERCRTFAWAASSAFGWDACATEGVLCQSFFPREAAGTWAGEAGSSDMLAFSIEHYGRKWAKYPYPVAVNVNGPVGGMEYPGIVFCSEREDAFQLWLVTTHEIGHAWFPMMVNTDERRHAWMDEGFNTFLNWYATLARYPELKDAGPYKGLLMGWFDAAKYEAFLKNARRPVSDTPPDRMPSSFVGLSQYAHPAVGLVLLREEILGAERFDVAFRDYCRLWAFKSPQPADFFRVMENAAGADLAWFWRGWFLERATCDLAVGLSSFVIENGGEEGVAAFTIENRGGLPMPALYRLTFADGSESTGRVPSEVWAIHDRHVVVVTFKKGAEPVRFAVDSELRLPDIDRSNNVATFDSTDFKR